MAREFRPVSLAPPRCTSVRYAQLRCNKMAARPRSEACRPGAWFAAHHASLTGSRTVTRILLAQVSISQHGGGGDCVHAAPTRGCINRVQ